MTETISCLGTSKVCFWSSQNTKWLFSRRRNSWCDPENDDNFTEVPTGQKILLNLFFYLFFFRIFYNRCTEYFKTSANFADILGKSSSQILANRTFHFKSQSGILQFYFINSSFHEQVTEI